MAANLGLDEAYEYDGLYQLTGLERGTLNVNRTTVGGVPAWDEAFTYDEAGNWQAYVTKVSGVPDLDQTRRHNRANEITFIDGSNQWVGHDGAGNMTRMPKVGDWDTAQTNTWDAWNRLVRVEEGEDLIGEYVYDGLTRRISKTSTEGETEVTRHGYFSTQWQLLEERYAPTDTVVDRSFVWGTRYIDDLILRDCFNFEPLRIYATHDQWHVTGLVNADGGEAVERYRYSAFGVSTVMDGEWVDIEESPLTWEFRYGAYRWDHETGLYCVRFRYLHPGLGRWLSRDPLGEMVGVTLYTYVANGPTQATDLLGLQETPPKPPRKTRGFPPGQFAVTMNCAGYAFCQTDKWYQPPPGKTYDDMMKDANCREIKKGEMCGDKERMVYVITWNDATGTLRGHLVVDDGTGWSHKPGGKGPRYCAHPRLGTFEVYGPNMKDEVPECIPRGDDPSIKEKYYCCKCPVDTEKLKPYEFDPIIRKK